MQVTKMKPEYTRWFKRLAEDEGFVVRGQVSLRAFFSSVAQGEYTVIKTDELDEMRRVYRAWQDEAANNDD